MLGWFEEVNDIAKHGHIVMVLGHLPSDVQPDVLGHGHGGTCVFTL